MPIRLPCGCAAGPLTPGRFWAVRKKRDGSKMYVEVVVHALELEDSAFLALVKRRKARDLA